MAESDGLFRRRPPLAAQMRPTSLDEVIGQDHLLQPGSPLRTLADPESERLARP